MDPRPFSPETRAENLARMARAGGATAPLDLLVIGGGITGAGIARDAALRGLAVGLVERRDFAAGTSSRSSKLIHGGIRYLQLGDFGLVRESAAERRILGRIAPHLVRPVLMVLPVRSRHAQLALTVALRTYAWLGSVEASERHATWRREETLARVPRLRPERLLGAVAYYESLTDDARLVLDTLKHAHAMGALVANYAEVVALEFERGSVAGARVRDVLQATEQAVAATVVINAAGPWVDAVRRLEGPLPRRQLHLTKGVHLTLPRRLLPVDHIVAFNARDGRPVFVVPHGDVVYVGTTDTDHAEPTDRPDITTADIAYLLDAVDRAFDVGPLDASALVSGWAGLRPLVHEEGKAPSEISRQDEIVTGPAGLLSIAGGKLTTYRRMAARIVDLAVAALARRAAPGHAPPGPCRTDREPLWGGDCPRDRFPALERHLAERHPVLHATTAARLVRTYGSQAEAVLAPAARAPDLLAPAGADTDVRRAELRYATEHEMALTVEDVLDRRTRALLFAPDQGRGMLTEVAACMSERLGWSPERRRAEIDGYTRLADTLRGRRTP
jgi:glycerol-3-phosphate dehydrogenase